MAIQEEKEKKRERDECLLLRWLPKQFNVVWCVVDVKMVKNKSMEDGLTGGRGNWTVQLCTECVSVCLLGLLLCGLLLHRCHWLQEGKVGR